MKIKLDEHLPRSLMESLSILGHDVDTVPGEGLEGSPDEDIFRAAQNEGRFLITQDMDFSDIRKFAPGTHCGILLVRLHLPGRKALLERIGSVFRTEDVAHWQRCFVVATDRKIRVRSPQDRSSERGVEGI